MQFVKKPVRQVVPIRAIQFQRMFTLIILICLNKPVHSVTVTESGYHLETYATMSLPFNLSINSMGYLYVSNQNNAGSIRLVEPINRTIWEIGGSFNDPDGIVFDRNGVMGGVAGSILVGAGEELWAIRPDHSMVRMAGSEYGLANIQSLLIDSSGRLLVVDQGAMKVFRSSGNFLDSWIEIYRPLSMAINPEGHIYVGTENSITVFDHRGQCKGYIDSGSCYVTGLAFGWDGDLFAAGHGSAELHRFAPDGTHTILAAGFDLEGAKGLVFGPDHALYISDTNNHTIYRLSRKSTDPLVLVLWNRLDSVQSAHASEVGPAGAILGSYEAFEPAMFGNGYVRLAVGEYLSFPAGILNNLIDAGTIEMWINPKVSAPVPYLYGIFSFVGSVFGHYEVPGSEVEIFWGDGVSGRGFWGVVRFGPVAVTTSLESTQFYATPGIPFHVAICWDIDGIDGTTETARVYRNGIKVSQASGIWDSAYIPTKPIVLGYGADSGGYNKFITDNIKIWNRAITDFSHRFEEDYDGIIHCPEADLTGDCFVDWNDFLVFSSQWLQ